MFQLQGDSCAGERINLSERRIDVRGLGRRHRLNGDGAFSADRYGTDVKLARGTAFDGHDGFMLFDRDDAATGQPVTGRLCRSKYQERRSP